LSSRARRLACAGLKSFSQDDRDHMVEDGKIAVTCEFCNRTYDFAPDEVGANDGDGE
jgi:molecular chaperone Hsp33